MAQRTIQLPAEIELICKHQVWTAGVAEYLGWKDSPTGLPYAVLRIVEPTRYAKFTGESDPVFLPESISTRVPRDNSHDRFTGRLHRDKQGTLIDVIISDAALRKKTSEMVPEHQVDGWEMREEFLRLERRMDALLGFLNRYGMWRPETSPHFFGPASHPYDSWEPRIVVPEQIWLAHRPFRTSGISLKDMEWTKANLVDVQTSIRAALTCEPHEWFDLNWSNVDLFGPRPAFPHFVINADYSFDVICKTVTIDHLRGTKFRNCARPDCPMPFAIESQHKRLYCRNYCAHLESVRRNRKSRENRTTGGKNVHL